VRKSSSKSVSVFVADLWTAFVSFAHKKYLFTVLLCVSVSVFVCVPVGVSVFSTWPHLNSDVGLEEGEY